MNIQPITLEEYKTIKGITLDTQDEAINILIVACADYIVNETQNDFATGYDNGMKAFAVKFIDFLLNTNSNITSEKTGNYSANYQVILPTDLKSMLNPYKKAICY